MKFEVLSFLPQELQEYIKRYNDLTKIRAIQTFKRHYNKSIKFVKNVLGKILLC